ncbi:DNA-binding anti-repressor SinI [Priestia megaterium]
MLKEEDNTLNQEWISLMKEAYQLGLSIVEVKEFIYLNQKEPISK